MNKTEWKLHAGNPGFIILWTLEALSGIHSPSVEEIDIVNDTGFLLSYTLVIHAISELVEIQRSSTPQLHHEFETREFETFRGIHFRHSLLSSHSRRWIFSPLSSSFSTPTMNSLPLCSFSQFRCVLNDCIPPKFICWNFTLDVMIFEDEAFSRWLGHRGGVLMNRALIKRSQRALPPLLPYEISVRRHCLLTRKQALTEHQIFQYLDLGLPSL